MGAAAALGTLEGYEHRQITVLLCFSWTVIGGGYLIWLWLRQAKSIWFALFGHC